MCVAVVTNGRLSSTALPSRAVRQVRHASIQSFATTMSATIVKPAAAATFNQRRLSLSKSKATYLSNSACLSMTPRSSVRLAIIEEESKVIVTEGSTASVDSSSVDSSAASAAEVAIDLA